MFNVGFLSSGVTRACLNAVGKMPVRRDVLIMCVSAGQIQTIHDKEQDNDMATYNKQGGSHDKNKPMGT